MDEKLTIGSLFSGIGGLEHGLEQTGGFRTIWQSEIDRYASAVLKKHWPDIPNLGNIRGIGWNTVRTPDVLCGGFPCQDISVAGKGAGIREGTRSGLWFEFARAIRALRPRYVVVENVPMLIKRGMHTVLAGLAEAGYDAEWHNISASSVGAWHRRERIFIIAHSTSKRCCTRSNNEQEHQNSSERKSPSETEQFREGLRVELGKSSDVPDTFGFGQPKRPCKDIELIKPEAIGAHIDNICRATCKSSRGIWATEPDVGRVANGVPNRVDRIKCLGNAVVPQVAQVVGEMILEMEAKEKEGKR